MTIPNAHSSVAYRGHVPYVAEHGHEHGHPPSGHGRGHGLDQPRDLHGQIVEVVSTEQQPDAGEELADDRDQHARLPLVVPVAPRPDEYDEHGRYAALHDRLPYDHVGHQLLDHHLVLLGVVVHGPALQRRARDVVHPQVHPARLLQVKVLRGQRGQHAANDVASEHRFHRAVLQHELGLTHDAQRLPRLVVLVLRGRFLALRRTRFVSHFRHRFRRSSRRGSRRYIRYMVAAAAAGAVVASLSTTRPLLNQSETIDGNVNSDANMSGHLKPQDIYYYIIIICVYYALMFKNFETFLVDIFGDKQNFNYTLYISSEPTKLFRNAAVYARPVIADKYSDFHFTFHDYFLIILSPNVLIHSTLVNEIKTESVNGSAECICSETYHK